MAVDRAESVNGQGSKVDKWGWGITYDGLHDYPIDEVRACGPRQQGPSLLRRKPRSPPRRLVVHFTVIQALPLIAKVQLVHRGSF